MGLHDELRALGLAPGDTVMVHASMRAVGGRAEAAIAAILDVVGVEGTLVAYVDFEPTKEIPGFDLVRSPAARDHGVFAEVLRCVPGAVRSANPGASMVAMGRRAAWICADHPFDYGYGPGTPLAKLVEVDGKVLLLGSHFDHVTLLHHAEHLAQIPRKRIVRYTVDVGEARLELEEYDTSEGVVSTMPDDYFAQVVAAFVDAGGAATGRVGGATSYLFSAPALVTFAVARLERDFG